MKNRYIKMRNSQNYNFMWFWEFYNENENSKYSHLEFLKFFPIYFKNNFRIIIDHLDEYFILNILIDSNNKEIKVYEQ